jgi:hypothetical protein
MAPAPSIRTWRSKRWKDLHRARGYFPGHRREKALEELHQGHQQGAAEDLSKMGISTLQSYRGAQVFEAIG